MEAHMSDKRLVLHLRLVRLKTPDARLAMVQRFAALATVDGVAHMGWVDSTSDASTHDLALFVYLRDAHSLERFGTNARHIEFLAESFLPAVRDFVSLDLTVEGAPPATYERATCLCLDIPAAAYEWQVDSTLRALAGDADASSLGRALNKRQPFRAGGIVFGEASTQTGETIVQSVLSVAGRATPLA